MAIKKLLLVGMDVCNIQKTEKNRVSRNNNVIYCSKILDKIGILQGIVQGIMKL